MSGEQNFDREECIVWLQDPARYSYVRESVLLTRRRKGRIPSFAVAWCLGMPNAPGIQAVPTDAVYGG